MTRIKTILILQVIKSLDKIIFFFSLFILSFSIFSCNSNINIDDYKKNVTGGLNELLVVLPKQLQNSPLADSIDAIFKKATVGLFEYEPSFSIIKTPPFSLRSFLKSHRSILQVEITPNARNKVYTKNEKWAYTQAYAKLEATDAKTAIKLLVNNKHKLFRYFKEGEYNRLGKLFRQNPDNELLTAIESNFDLKFYAPAPYNINKPKVTTNDFMWLSKEEAKTSQGFFIYSFDYTDKEKLSKTFLTKLKKVLWKNNVSGPVYKSYMTVSDNFPVTATNITFNNCFAVKLNGYWETKGYFMGGPFISIAILNPAKRKVVVIDGYVYGPENSKRNLLTEIQAIMHSVEFVENAK